MINKIISKAKVVKSRLNKYNEVAKGIVEQIRNILYSYEDQLTFKNEKELVSILKSEMENKENIEKDIDEKSVTLAKINERIKILNKVISKRQLDEI